jgi:hypothetical protein
MYLTNTNITSPSKRHKIQDLDATPIDNIPNMYTDFAYDYIQTLKKIQALPHH